MASTYSGAALAFPDAGSSYLDVTPVQLPAPSANCANAFLVRVAQPDPTSLPRYRLPVAPLTAVPLMKYLINHSRARSVVVDVRDASDSVTADSFTLAPQTSRVFACVFGVWYNLA